MGTFARKYSLEPVAVPRVRTRHRRIVTTLPVPESLPLLERLERFEPASMQGQPPVMIHRAKGWYVEDRWGNRWMDWSTGVLISNAGNGNPAIVAALRRTLRRPLLCTYVFPHEDRALLVEELAALAREAADPRSASSPEGAPKAPTPGRRPAPKGRTKAPTSGCSCSPRAPRPRRTASSSRRPGASSGTGPSAGCSSRSRTASTAAPWARSSPGGSDGAKRWMGRLDDSFVQVPFPDGYKNPDTRFELFLETLAAKGVRPEQVCGVMAESYQGVGPDFLPVDYAQRLEEWCRKHDVVLVMDEVQAGFCRTGEWFAFQHYGITPDLIACGKGISSSLPLSAVIGRADIMGLYAPGSMTSTHSGSPLPVAAALANVRELRRGPYLANARALDPVLREGLLAIQRRHPAQAGCVQARGLVAGIQIVKPGTREPDGATALTDQPRLLPQGPADVRPGRRGRRMHQDRAPARHLARGARRGPRRARRGDGRGAGLSPRAARAARCRCSRRPTASTTDRHHRPSDRQKASIYRAVAASPGCSRSTLARRLRLRPTTVSHLVQELLDDGLVAERRDRVAGRSGRPRASIEPVPARLAAVSLCVEIARAARLAGRPRRRGARRRRARPRGRRRQPAHRARSRSCSAASPAGPRRRAAWSGPASASSAPSIPRARPGSAPPAGRAFDRSL